MNKAIAVGSMYRVAFTGKRVEPECTYVADDVVLLVAMNEEDALLKFPWVVDLSEFGEYQITSCDKQSGRVITLSHKERRVPHEEPDANIKRETGTDPVWQKVFGEPKHKYVCIASTTCYAKNMVHAEEKLRKRLADGVESVKYQIEEVAIDSGFAMPKDQSVFTRAHIIGQFGRR